MRASLALLVLGTTSACAHEKGLEQELSRLRREVHALRRSVEETRADVERVEQQVDVLQARTPAAPSSAPQAGRGPTPSAPSTPSLPVVRISPDGAALDVDAGAIDDGSPPILIKMGPDPSPRIPVNKSVLRRPDPVLDARSDATPKDQYEEALATLREENQPARALALFRAFERAHPDSSYADNAAYWAGEALMRMEDWTGASESFLRVLERYPRSSKRPYSLLRLGESLRARGNEDEARRRLQELVDDYPGTEPAEQARALLDGANERNL
ncbi:MAG: tol-pal system protein YbgF [Myxococcota bacterium]